MLWAALVFGAAATLRGPNLDRSVEETKAWLGTHLKEEFDPEFVPWNWHDIKPRNARDDAETVVDQWKADAKTAKEQGKAQGVKWRMSAGGGGEGSTLEGIMGKPLP